MRFSQRFLVLPAVLATLLLAPSAASALTQTDLDSSFGANGVATPALPPTDSLVSVSVQPDGKTVGAYRGVPNAPLAFRLNADGSLDQSFGAGGRVDLAVMGMTNISVKRVQLAADGTIYIAGSGSLAGNVRVAVWALTASGAPKLSFNGTGSRVLPIVPASPNNIGDAAITPSGSLAVAAEAISGGDDVISLRVVDPSGAITVDVTRTIPASDVDPESLTAMPDGRLIVGATLDGGGQAFGLLFAFSSTGVAEPTFGGPGYATFGPSLPLFTVPLRVFNVGGQIGAVGTVGFTSAVGIFTPDGVAIPSIGSLGAKRSFPPGAAFAFLLDGGAVAGNKILGVGQASGAESLPPYIERFNADGTPDNSFTPGGSAYLPAAADTAASFALQPDGKYVIALASPDDRLSLLRMWGDSPAPQPAVVAFSRSLKSKLKVNKARRFSGTTGGTGITKVELAIQKVDSKLLKKSKRCSYVKSKNAALKNYKAVSRKCVPGKWLGATGTSQWSLKLSKSLKPGKYVLSARATGVLGVSTVIAKSITLTK
ncbi:MAG: hypothetical protein HYX29_02230 [Solirubrobacterales bacterium]|nr:hypothetical protein [Solirubrobacterales bacterium]